jgi:hypothetical protein
MIFGIIKSDDKVFTGDKIRVDLSDSFLAPGSTFDTISHEVSFDLGVTWFDISQRKYIDWIFGSPGTKTIQARFTTTAPLTTTISKDVECLDLTLQGLFSKDSDLYQYETEIDQYLPKKWSSWNLIHLQAQEWIMDLLAEKRILNQDGKKYVVADLLDKQEVKQMSVAKALELIYESNINSPDDLFTQKRNKYKEMLNDKVAKSFLTLDYNQNTTAEADEKIDMHSVAVYRV